MRQTRIPAAASVDEPDLAGPGLGRPSLALPSYQRVRDAIRVDIARGELAGGARLKTADLVRRYGLSPAPIREALSQLEAEGWVVIAPNRGASVRVIDERLLLELNEIRIALDSYIARRAAEAATPAQVAVLEAIQAEYEAAMGDQDARALIRINARFHAAIRALRENREATRLIRRHGAFFNTIRLEWGYRPERPRQVAREHRALLDAFRRNDGDAAERISREHIQHAMDDLLARWRDGDRLPRPATVPPTDGEEPRPASRRSRQQGRSAKTAATTEP